MNTSRYLIDGKPLPPARTRKSTGVMLYLVENRGKKIDRASLANLFWPGVPKEKALNSLRQALSHIQACLGPNSPIVSERMTVTCLPARVEVVPTSKKESDGGGNQASLNLNRLKSCFQSMPVDQFLSRLTGTVKVQSLAAAEQLEYQFYLAFAYHELGFADTAFDCLHSISGQLDYRKTSQLQHGLGALAWHQGDVAPGLRMLGKAYRMEEEDRVHRLHILSNYCIGAFEGRLEDQFHEGLREFRGGYSLDVVDQFKFELPYLEAMECWFLGHVEPGITLLERMINQAEGNRIAVYYRELLAHFLLRSGDETGAQGAVRSASGEREVLKMRPSVIEGRRLRSLRQAIGV